MRLSIRHRIAVGGAKVALALIVVSGAVGSVPLTQATAVQPHVHAARAAAGLSLAGTARGEVLRGGPRNDWLHGGAGRDVLLGGAGNDGIDAVDGARDVVRCGPGYDQVTADRADEVAPDCESVIRRDS